MSEMDSTPSKERVREQRKANYAYYKERGLCVSCGGQRPADYNRVQCSVCLEKAQVRWERRYIRETEAQRTDRLRKAREYQKARYEQRKAEGRCVKCGKALSNPQFVHCTECRIASNRMNRDRWRETHNPIPKAMWVELGLCGLCGKRPLEPGFRVCAQCHQIYITRAKKPPTEKQIEAWKQYTERGTVFNKMLFSAKHSYRKEAVT